VFGIIDANDQHAATWVEDERKAFVCEDAERGLRRLDLREFVRARGIGNIDDARTVVVRDKGESTVDVHMVADADSRTTDPLKAVPLTGDKR